VPTASTVPSGEIALATYRNPHGVPAEDLVLAAALRRRGATVAHAIWDDPTVDWARFGVVVVRSTWDYHRKRPEFLGWVRRVARVTRLWNPADTLRWNTDKRYLRDLEEAGVPVVPSIWCRPHRPANLRRTMEERRWSVVVVKPAVSAAGTRTFRIDRSAVGRGQRHLTAICETGTAIVQPYYGSVDSTGERSLIYLDGRYSHSVRRNPLFLRRRRPGPERLVPATPAMRALALQALRACPKDLLYARVDLVSDEAGRWRVLEVELTEPSLFFVPYPRGADHLAASLLERVGR
jgi:glutathione synthase/RimK-type ligase-like ATP-grasp enzyme